MAIEGISRTPYVHLRCPSCSRKVTGVLSKIYGNVEEKGSSLIVSDISQNGMREEKGSEEKGSEEKGSQRKRGHH